MKKLILLIALCVFASTAGAHRGRTDGSGCHHDRIHGGYHCHHKKFHHRHHAKKHKRRHRRHR